ncbi:unnamed protein product [Urochloa decumbens]|uniref:F-box domain-containing protein n=1 Tax=Urochloa decumbens TaxID=240449 RepID=A0ABC9EY82_9POAL
MEKKAAAMRRKKPTPATTRRPTTQEKDVPYHLLVLVMRRLDSHISFLRAAAVCKRWRRVVYVVLTRPGFIYPFGHYHVPDPSYSPAQHRVHPRPTFHRQLRPLASPSTSSRGGAGRGSSSTAAAASSSPTRGAAASYRTSSSANRSPGGTAGSNLTRTPSTTAASAPSSPRTDFTVICVTYDRSDRMAQDVGPLTVRLYSDRYRRGWGWLDKCNFRFVDEVREVVYPEIVRLACLIGDELRVYVEEAQGHTRNWVLKRKLCLPETTLGLPRRKACYFGLIPKLVTAGDGYIVLTPAEETWLFSVELKTMRMEREHSRNRIAGEVYTYELQTSPNVHASVVKCKREGHGPFRRGVGSCSHICVCG